MVKAAIRLQAVSYAFMEHDEEHWFDDLSDLFFGGEFKTGAVKGGGVKFCPSVLNEKKTMIFEGKH